MNGIFQIHRVDLALGGGSRGVVPPHGDAEVEIKL